MNRSLFPLWPVAASSVAGEEDWLFIALLVLSSLILILVFGLMLTFAVRYRRGSTADRGHRVQKSWHWEIGWTSATFVIGLGLFAWGADLYLRLFTPPEGAEEVQVVGKQWMWKIEHPGGQREIDELHVAVDRPVRLVMTSQDVIHSFYIPAFRVKHDVVPGRYETLWFEPTEVGEYHLFCTEFCGTEHAAMGGRVVVMPQADFSRWLTEQGAPGTLAQQGGTLFRSLGCSGCHGPNSTVHAPPLDGLYGQPVPLQDGRTVKADERYLRDSILLPNAEIAAGYPAIMPSFAGQIEEDDLLKLIAYLKSLSPSGGPSR